MGVNELEDESTKSFKTSLDRSSSASKISLRFVAFLVNTSQTKYKDF